MNHGKPSLTIVLAPLVLWTVAGLGGAGPFVHSAHAAPDARDSAGVGTALTGGLGADDADQGTGAESRGSGQSEILDLNERIRKFREITPQLLRDQFPPELKSRLVVLARAKAERDANPESIELNAEYHAHYSAAIKEFEQHLQQVVGREAQSLNEMDSLEQGMDAASSSYVQQAADARKESADFAAEHGVMVEGLKSMAAKVSAAQQTGRAKPLTPEHDQAVTTAHFLAQTQDFKARLAARKAQELARQVQEIEKRKSELAVLRARYKIRLEKAKNARALVADLADWQNDQVKNVQMQAALRGLEFGDEGDEGMDFSNITLIDLPGSADGGGDDRPAGPAEPGPGSEILKQYLATTSTAEATTEGGDR